MTIQILGGGCAKCFKLAENAEKALKNAGKEAVIEKITDFEKIMEMGVMTTPALAIDGNVKSKGKLLTPEEISTFL